ncbi:MAG TPA: ABC transporter substrate-binding protein [Bacillota bacterium]|nr:ABC transporter substrate-binding protein [Bacillota bacterium]
MGKSSSKFTFAILFIMTIVSLVSVNLIVLAKESGVSKKLVTIRLANLQYGLGSIPHDLAIQKGIFKKHGIDLQVINFAKGGAEAAAAVASGHVDMGSFGTPILTAISKGISIKIVASPPVKENPFVLVGKNEIKSVKDLKGKTIATGALGGGNHQALLKILYANGLTDKDVDIIATGGTDAELILNSGKVEAVSTSEPTVAKIARAGEGHVLAEAVDYYGHYQHSFVFATDALIRSNPKAIGNFLKASREAYQYAKNHQDELVAFAKQKLEMDDGLIRDYFKNDISKWDLSFKVDIEGTANAVKIVKDLGEIDKGVTFNPKTWLDLRFL